MIARVVRHRILRPVALAVLTWPGTAAACAVCFSGRTDEQRVAFGVTTIFLSVLPLAVIGSVALWVRHRARTLAAAPSSVRGSRTVGEAVPVYSRTSIR